MTLNVWTENSGYSFGTFQERVTLDLPLPVSNDNGVTYSVISGSLPNGLTIQGNRIAGTPYEVPRNTEFRFCIRAKLASSISDRTYVMSVANADGPEFITAAGNLPVGIAQQLFTIDSTYIDFQIEVTDLNLIAGGKLTYFISRDDGELPPGLILTSDGRIVGFVQPVLSIKPEDGDGTYDDSYYDAVAFDFAVRPSNGYDSYIYDTVTFDFNVPAQPAKKLNRNYEFFVSVSDGDVTIKRKFDIFVVGDDYFRADNTLASSFFTADVTYLRAPIWVTASDLGTYRSNNYVTIALDTYDTENVINNLELVNTEIKAVANQILLTDNVAGGTYLTVNTDVPPAYAQYLTFTGLVSGATSKIYQISHVTALGSGNYRLTLTDSLEENIPNAVSFYIGSLSKLPLGLVYDVASSTVYGNVPYQPAITTTYSFTIKSTRLSDKFETASSFRTFTVNIIGEIDSVINWVTGPDLGTVNANFVSTLSVAATSTVPNAMVIYQIKSGALPPGLGLDLDGEIVGKVNQYATNTSIGLTTFDFISGVTTFDNSTTTIDRVYTFTIEARDQFGISAVRRTFTIRVDTPNELVFSNIKVKPFLKLEQRASWKNFINDPQIFTPSSIYRNNDDNFGIQKDLSMIIYAGIETTDAAAYIGAIGLNHKRKRFQFGSVKQATAYKSGTNTAIYEVIYIEMLDPLEPNGKRLANKLTGKSLQPEPITVDNGIDWNMNLEQTVTVDGQGYVVSNPNSNTYFPSSVSNWQERISAVGETERNYLPLWMRSIQSGTKSELGFKLAVPLCFCAVGQAADIILNIKHSGFDFTLLDYTVDRYIIDSVAGSTGDKYLVFRNDRITV